MTSPPYSPVYRAGDWACVSGQLGMVDGALPGIFGDQARQLFQNLDALLSAGGMRRDQVAKTTVFLADMGDYAEMNTVYLEYFGEHRPARSAVAVAGLPFDALIEAEAWVFTANS